MIQIMGSAFVKRGESQNSNINCQLDSIKTILVSR